MDELSIQAVADAHGGLERLNVDVRRADPEGLGKHLQHQADDGRVFTTVPGLVVSRGNRDPG